MRPRTILRYSPFILLILIIIGYTLFNARAFIGGPHISIITPYSGQSFFEPRITLEGRAENIKQMTLNDRPMSVTRDGLFKEKLLLLPGYNIIKVRGTDAFGRSREETLELVLLQDIDLDTLRSMQISTTTLKSSGTSTDESIKEPVIQEEEAASTTLQTN